MIEGTGIINPFLLFNLMNLQNPKFLQGIIALLAVIIVIGGFGMIRNDRRHEYRGPMMHRMPDGTMMSNTGMDMDSTMKGMMSGLDGKTGDAFDKEFLAEMIVHHQGAVDMANAVLKSSNRPELKAMANDIITAQTKEIEMMKNWQTAWFK